MRRVYGYMMMLLNRNLVFLYLVFALSLGYLITAINLGSPLSDGRVEPSFFPILLGIFSVTFSAILVFREFASIKRSSQLAEDDSSVGKANYSPLWVMLSIFIYIMAFQVVGYFLSSFLFVLSIIVIFSSLDKIIQKTIISLIIAALGYLVFEQMFGVRLPALWG